MSYWPQFDYYRATYRTRNIRYLFESYDLMGEYQSGYTHEAELLDGIEPTEANPKAGRLAGYDDWRMLDPNDWRRLEAQDGDSNRKPTQELVNPNWLHI